MDELHKRRDDQSRELIAQTIEELSQHVSLQSYDFLRQHEIRYWLAPESFSYHIDLTVWTYAFYVAGEHILNIRGLDNETQSAAQKALFDRCAAMSVPDTVRLTPDYVTDRHHDIVEGINRNIEANRGDRGTFKETYQHEVDQLLDGLSNKLEAIAATAIPAVLIIRNESHGRYLRNHIRNELLKDGSKELPGMRIMAGLSASTRHRKERFEDNDVHDYQHARYALPYCDVFLTENHLGTLLTNLRYDTLYDCRVLWDPDEIAAELEKMFPG